MVGLEPLTCPVGPTEVMMIVRLEPPRPPGLLLPGPLRLLRLLMRFQLPRSDVNVVAGAGRWSTPPLLPKRAIIKPQTKRRSRSGLVPRRRREARYANRIPGTALAPEPA